MQFHEHQLKNGLKIVGESNPSARSVAVGFWVRTGSRDETSDVCGVSHFLEHMVFKGTPRRTVHEVNQAFDRIGANYNAFTSEENTVFYTSILPEYLPQGVDILADILRPSLREDDFETEKGVIIEEIGMYDDQPMWSAYDRAKTLYFADHPLGNSILGTPQSITDLQREQMQSYFDRRYVPANITVSAAGSFNWRELLRLIERHCGKWENGSARRHGLRSTNGSGQFKVEKNKTIHQEHVVLISSGPPAKSPLCYAANLLATIVGDDSGSRLYWSLVDRGLSDSADMSFSEYDGAGAFFTMFSCNAGTAQKNLRIIHGLFRQLQKEGVSEEELRQAKNKVLARLVRGSERPMGRMQALGHNWLYLKKYLTLDDEMKSIEAVTVRKIGQVLERYPLEQTTTFALGPLDKLRRPGR